MPDETCGVFGTLDQQSPALDRDRIHSLVVGKDTEPRPMERDEAERELGDPFATLLLLQGKFPRSAAECVEAIKAAVPDGDPLRNQMSFLLGEGSQIPVDVDSETLERGVRFVVTLGATANGPPNGPDLLLSVSHPDQTGVELMAWDRVRGGFNYYRSVGDGPAWMFAGNARRALADPTQGKGPFESHKSGAFLMKELKLPWVNWHSRFAPVEETAFAENDDRTQHEWFKGKEEGGAYTFELAVAKPAIARWGRARFREVESNGGDIEDPGRIMEQLLATPTANLASSRRQSRRLATPEPPVDLPSTFFVDADGFAEVNARLGNGPGLAQPPLFEVPGDVYLASRETFDVRLQDGHGFDREADTFFAFVVPERAFEDQVALREAMRIGLVTPRLAACLLMTDFPNPIFSDRRAALLARVPKRATTADGQSGFSQEMADAILESADGEGDFSPEGEFKKRWDEGENFARPFNELLGAYYAGITEQLKSEDGFNAYVRLAESRRQRGAAEMPIFRENRLLFAQTNVQPASRSMQPNGEVAEV